MNDKNKKSTDFYLQQTYVAAEDAKLDNQLPATLCQLNEKSVPVIIVFLLSYHIFHRNQPSENLTRSKIVALQ